MASSLSQKQAPAGSKGASERVKQRLIIIRHGERLDNVDLHWERTAERPYDPPLTEDGEEEVRTVGQERFSEKDIHYIISSPFLRCLQTAQLLCDTLKLPGIHTCNRIVDVLNGCCRIYQQPAVPASDIAQYGIKILKYDENALPKYPENTRAALQRYVPTFNDLADQYWPHNIIVVTHGYGVIEAVNLAPQAKQGPVCVYYCGHVELSRESQKDHAWTMESHKDVFHS